MKIIIVGAGEVGFHIASRLAHENKDVVVIDTDAAAIARVSENIDVEAVVGSGSSPVVLEEAGIKEAEILLAVTDSDETNLVACLVANVVSPSTKKIARIRNADYDDYVDAFRDNPPYIDTLINPETEVVKTISRMMRYPGAADVGDFAEGRVKFVGIYLDEGAKVIDIPLEGLAAQIGIHCYIRPSRAAVGGSFEHHSVVGVHHRHTDGIVCKRQAVYDPRLPRGHFGKRLSTVSCLEHHSFCFYVVTDYGLSA